MRIIFREPLNQPLRLMEIENHKNSNKAINELIGGYYQVVPIGKGVLCLLDEEGRLKELGNNFYHDKYGWIVGNVIFIGVDGEEYASLTDEQIKFVEEYIGFPVVE